MDEKFGRAHSRRGKVAFRSLNRYEQYEHVLVRGRVTLNGVIFTVVPCILILSKSSIYQLMHNSVALK
jgi:hypothetical protein